MRTFQRHDSTNNLHVCASERARNGVGVSAVIVVCGRGRFLYYPPGGRLRRPSLSFFNVATRERENPLKVVLVLLPDFFFIFFENTLANHIDVKTLDG